jgi:hypothetical protein
MRLIRLLFLLSFAAGPSLFAAACAPALLSVYDFSGFTCQMGPLTIKDVTYSMISGTVTVADTDITVTPFFTGLAPGLKISSSKFAVSGTDSFKSVLTYFWDPGDIRGFLDTLDDPVVPPGLVKITTAYCSNGEFGIACPPAPTITSTLFDNGTTSHLVDFVPVSGVSTLGVQDTIELDANGSSASFTDFMNQLVPEPSTWTLVLLAAAIVLWQLRRPLGGRVRHLRL